MKRLWRMLDREMQRESLNARQMAAKLSMDPAHFSRLRTGQIRDLSADSLGGLLAGLPSDRHPEFLSAYLADKLEGAGLQISEAVPVADQVREAAPAYGREIPSSIEDACRHAGVDRRVAQALAVLAEQAPGDRRLRMLIVSLAGFARKK